MAQRIAFRFRLKTEKLEQYKRLHRDVWSELLRDLTGAGARNYSIFADGAEEFGCLECDDWSAFLVTIGRSDANRRWQVFMADYLATAVDPDSPDPFQLLEEIFHLP